MNFSGINPIALAVFSFIALIVQVPVLLVQTNGMAPNMPIAALTIWLMYINISIFINSVMFNSADFDSWWSGRGWCDVDTHVTDASTIGIMLVALTISCRLLYMSRPRTKRMRPSQIMWWHVFDACVCFLIPLANIIVHPFTTVNRYSIVQSLGCHGVAYQTAPTFLFHTVLPLLVSSLLLVVNFLTLVQFFTRGRESVYQALAFKERFSVNFFWRSVICCVAIMVTCVPVIVYIAANNITNFGELGPIPWAHGKPKHWDVILAFTWADLADQPEEHKNILLAQATRVIIVFISFVSFFCFGTGSAAVMFYQRVYRAFAGKHRKAKNVASPTILGTPYSSEFTKNDKEDINVHVSEYIPTSRG